MSRLPIQILVMLAFALTLFLLWDLGQRVVVNLRIDQTEKDLDRQVAQAQATQTALKALQTRVASPEYAEEYARTQWRWLRDGETLAVPQITPAAPATSPTPAPSAPQPEAPWWKNLWDFLLGP